MIESTQSLDLYNTISQQYFDQNIANIPTTGHSEINYTNEYMTRSFVRKINSGLIYEINPESAELSHLNPLYTSIQIDWKITGGQNNLITNGVTVIYGVMETNQLTIDRVKKQGFTDISSVLRDPLEFWRGY